MPAIIGHKSAFGCAQNLQFRSLERCLTGFHCSRKPTDTHHQVSNPSKISSAANTANSWPTRISQRILFHQRHYRPRRTHLVSERKGGPESTRNTVLSR